MSGYEREILTLMRVYRSALIEYHATLAHLDAMTALYKGADIPYRQIAHHPLYLAVLGRNSKERTRNMRLAELDAALLRGVKQEPEV